jgi:class 3 adenylate cyclase
MAVCATRFAFLRVTLYHGYYDAADAPTSMPAPVRHAPEAARRRVTVMFCDLVDSTKLS